MKEHILSEHSQKHSCVYCGESLQGKEWISEFHFSIHYKTIKCDCGKKVRITMDFPGSGHDSWDSTHAWITKTDLRQKEKKDNKSIEHTVKEQTKKTDEKDEQEEGTESA